MPTNEEFKKLILRINKHQEDERKELGFIGCIMRSGDEYLPLTRGEQQPDDNATMVAWIHESGILPTKEARGEEVHEMIGAYRMRFGTLPDVKCGHGDHFLPAERLLITEGDTVICTECLQGEIEFAWTRFSEEISVLRPAKPLLSVQKRVIPLT